MAQFSFKDFDLTLDFPTCTFTVRCDSDYSDKIKNMGEEFTGLNKKNYKDKITKDNTFKKIKKPNKKHNTKRNKNIVSEVLFSTFSRNFRLRSK